MVIETNLYDVPRSKAFARNPSHVPRSCVSTDEAARTAIALGERVAANPKTPDLADERQLFHAMHTCGFHARGKARATPLAPLKRFEWENRWKLLRDYIVEQNLGLAYAGVGRFSNRRADLDELRSEAFLALTRAVEGFDPWRGFKFSTYATTAISRGLMYATNKAIRYRLLFPIEHDASFERPVRSDRDDEPWVDRLTQALDLNLGQLTAREGTVLEWRFPTGGGAGLTLREIGKALGLSKERIRQIEGQALDKLREVLKADPLLQ